MLREIPGQVVEGTYYSDEEYDVIEAPEEEYYTYSNEAEQNEQLDSVIESLAEEYYSDSNETEQNEEDESGKTLSDKFSELENTDLSDTARGEEIIEDFKNGIDPLVPHYKSLVRVFKETCEKAHDKDSYKDENFEELHNMIVSNSDSCEGLKTRIENYKGCYAKYYGKDVADRYEKNILELSGKIKRTSKYISQQKEKYDQQLAKTTTAKTVSTNTINIDPDVFTLPLIIMSIISVVLIATGIILKFKKPKERKTETAQKAVKQKKKKSKTQKRRSLTMKKSTKKTLAQVVPYVLAIFIDAIVTTVLKDLFGVMLGGLEAGILIFILLIAANRISHYLILRIQLKPEKKQTKAPKAQKPPKNFKFKFTSLKNKITKKTVIIVVALIVAIAVFFATYGFKPIHMDREVYNNACIALEITDDYLDYKISNFETRKKLNTQIDNFPDFYRMPKSKKKIAIRTYNEIVDIRDTLRTDCSDRFIEKKRNNLAETLNKFKR